MADNIFLLFVSLVVGMIACIPYVFPWLINEQYVSGYGLIPISLLATLANVVVGLVSVIYVGEKNTKAIAKTSAMAAMINIACHLCLIHFIGLYAAVVSSLVAFSVMAVYRIADIRKKYMRIAFKKKTLVLSAAAIAAVCAAYYINNVYINALALVGAVAFAFFANKPSIGNLVGIVKRKLH